MTKSQAATTAKIQQANEARKATMQAKKNQEAQELIKSAMQRWGNPSESFRQIAGVVITSVRSDVELVNLVSAFIDEHAVNPSEERLLSEGILYAVKLKAGKAFDENEKLYRTKIQRVVSKCFALSSPSSRSAQNKLEQQKKFDNLVKQGKQALANPVIVVESAQALASDKPEQAQRALEAIAGSITPALRNFAIVNSIGNDFKAWSSILKRALSEYGDQMAECMQEALDAYHQRNDLIDGLKEADKATATPAQAKAS